MSRLQLAAIALITLIVASLACTVATPTPAPTVMAPTQAALAVEPTSAPLKPTLTSAATPKPSATNTRAPTARTTTVALPAGTLFDDDFGSQSVSEDKGWVFDTSDTVGTAWAAGKFIVTVNKKNWIGLNWPDGTYENFGAQTEGQATGGDYAEYGLVFRVGGVKDARTYYIFGVNTDGKYYLQKKIDGTWADTDPVPATASKYIKPKAKNTLGVLAQGNQISLYINGFMVNSLKDDSSKNGMVGVFASTGDNDSTEVTFSRFTILTTDKAKADWGTTLASDSGAQPTETPKTGTGSGLGTIAVVNNFPGACEATVWQGDKKWPIRAEANSSRSIALPPGTYGLHVAADVGQVDMQQFHLPPGGYCQITCDKATKSVYNSCR
jgi:hypothetical protein